MYDEYQRRSSQYDRVAVEDLVSMMSSREDLVSMMSTSEDLVSMMSSSEDLSQYDEYQRRSSQI